MEDTLLDEEPATSHSVTLSGLTPDTLYYYQIKFSDTLSNEVESNIEAFNTLALEDTVAPVISEIFSSATETSATITWTTDEPATGQVEYGDADNYGQTSDLVEKLTREHSIVLTDLEFGATYHFAIRSSDATGNESVSDDKTFTTSSLTDTVAPLILGVHVSDNLNRTVTISWTTNELASSKIVYWCDT